MSSTLTKRCYVMDKICSSKIGYFSFNTVYRADRYPNAENASC